MKILWQNKDFAIIEKPAGVLSVPGREGAKDKRPVAGLVLQEQLQRQVFPVHRLDCEVQGILLFALSAEAHRAANSWFEQRLVKKVYRALTPLKEGFLAGQSFSWDCLLLRGKKRAYEHPQGKQSHTQAQILQVLGPSLEWGLEPITGRSHQLRYEMYRHGLPIHGDTLYGSQEAFGSGAIALVACRLQFPPEASEKWGLPPEIKISPPWECKV